MNETGGAQAGLNAPWDQAEEHPEGLSQDERWARWVLQSARKWEDIANLIKPTHIDSVDDDHRRMTEIALRISNLLDLLQDGKLDLGSVRDQERILNNLYIGVAGHFEREERIMRRYKLPGFAAHKGQHDDFLDQLQAYITDFKDGRLTTAVNIKTTILEWWIDHINEVDFKTFRQRNWTDDVLMVAKTWDDVAELVKQTKVEDIDAEHRAVTEQILALLDSNDDKAGQPWLGGVFPDWQSPFQALISLATEHFANEERFVQDNGFDGHESLREQHQAFFAVLADCEANIRAGHAKLDDDMVFTILKWWVDHMNTTDYETFSLEVVGDQLLHDASSWAELERFVSTVGQAGLDAEHRQFVETAFALERRIADLAFGAHDGTDGRAIGEALADLETQARDHFRQEEAILGAGDPRQLQLHKDEHARFLEMLATCRKDYGAGRMVMSRERLHRMIKWWVDHINAVDRRAFQELDAELRASREDADLTPLVAER